MPAALPGADLSELERFFWTLVDGFTLPPLLGPDVSPALELLFISLDDCAIAAPAIVKEAVKASAIVKVS